VNPHLDFVLSSIFDTTTLHPEHQADLDKSGITDETRRLHKIRSVPPDMIGTLLGFEPRGVRHALLFPFPASAGGFLDYVKMKIWADDAESAEVRGDHVEAHHEKWRYNGGARKYLVRRRAAPRLYLPIVTMQQALQSTEPLWLIEGMKKTLAVMQLGLPAVGIEGAWSWHVKGSRALLPDFSFIRLRDRLVEIVPDSDVATNPMIARSMRQLADALRAAGARPRLVRLPPEVKGADDFIQSVGPAMASA
jgi:uncharacterized protein DUF3854